VLTGAPESGIPTATSSFTGSVAVNAGTLVAAAVASGNNTVLGNATSSRSITVNAGATLKFAAPNTLGTSFNSTNIPTLTISGGTVTNFDPLAGSAGSGAINNALNNVALNNGVLFATTGQTAGYAAWNVNGTISSSGSSLISTSDPVYGSVMLNSAVGSSGTTTVNVSNGTLTISVPLVQSNQDNIVDALSMTGTGTLVLSGSNNYTGGTTVNGGTLIVTNIAAIADGTSLTVGNPAAFPAPAVPAAVVSAPTAISPVPEPGTLALLAAATTAGIVALRRKRRLTSSRLFKTN
jgi:autotransporter-associated beta strand protein